MNTIVIGSGIGGLVTACLLANKGIKVDIYEQHHSVGGKLNQLELGDYRFDTGPSLLTMPFILEKIFKTCNRKIDDYLDITPIEPICRYFFHDGTRFDNYADLQKNRISLSEIAPEDEENYVKFLGKSADLYQKTANSFIFNPLTDKKDFAKLNWLDLLGIDAFSTVSNSIDRSFNSRYLKQVFKRFATYNGSSPYKAPATLNVIPYVELAQGGYYIKGGMYQLGKALEKLADELGVNIHLNSKVNKIVVKNKRAKGITLDGGGSTQTADLIVSNMDSVLTNTLLLKENLDKKSVIKYERLEPSTSGFVLFLGINRTYRNIKHHNIFFSSDYEKEFSDMFVHKKPADDPTIYIANTSYSDQNHAPENHSNYFILVNAPYTTSQLNWEEIKNEYANRIITKLESHGLIDLEQHIVEKEILTPSDFESRYVSNRGSIYGLSSNNRYSAFLRPRNRSPHVKNLYLVGGGTHPGGGIPLASQSALNAVELINRDYSL